MVHTLDKRVWNGVEPTWAEHTGFIWFKDKTVVEFYTNDLSETPLQDVEEVSDYSLKFVQGLAPWKSYIGT